MHEDQDERDIFLETLGWICGKMESAGIEYMVTGGSAVGFWGHIRTTMDIDIVMHIRASQTDAFLRGIESDVHINAEEARNAVLSKKMFNIIYDKYCFKIDLIPLDEQDAYEIEKFGNRKKVKLGKMEVSVIAPEDLIITKLLWSKAAGGSERQLRDCESVYRLNGSDLDLDYIKEWAKRLNIGEELKKVC